MKHILASVVAVFANLIPSIARGALGVALLFGLAGCPLQTPTFETISANLNVAASAAAPLVGDTITLTVMAPRGGVDLSTATWQSSDPATLSLSGAVGVTVMAVAVKTGVAKVTVTAGALRGSVTITVLDSVGNIDLEGPTSLVVGQVARYTARVTNASGATIMATATWVASQTVALKTPGANTGSSIEIVATAVGAGAVTAQAGGRSAQIAVKVTATSGQLVITRADGTPVPTVVALGDPLTVLASYETTNGTADDAQWTYAGTCTLVGGSGATVSVNEPQPGTCTLTATAKGMTATVTFAVADVTDLKVTGDTKPLAIGELRTFTAVGLAGALQTGGVSVKWSTPNDTVISLQASGNFVQVLGVAVGSASLVATLDGKAMATVALTVAPSSLQITAPTTQVVQGAATTVTVTAIGPMAVAGRFSTAIGLVIAGATGFDTVGAGVLAADGSVTFALGGAKADSPAVTVSLGATVSNPLSFTLAKLAGVMVSGPQGPVRVGSGVDFNAVPLDAAGMRIDGDFTATWADATGVYTFPASTGLHVTANAVKLGTSAIVATVMGLASPPFASPAQPGSIVVTMFAPPSVAVGATTMTTVTVLDAMAVPIPNIPPSQVLLSADDPSKVSFAAGVLVGTGFQFTATGLAATPAAGVNVTATWTDGMFPIMSGAVPLIVTGP